MKKKKKKKKDLNLIALDRRKPMPPPSKVMKPKNTYDRKDKGWMNDDASD